MQPRGTYEERLHLNKGARLEGTFTVADHDISFGLFKVAGRAQLLISQNRVKGSYRFSWLSDESADYLLLFDNSYSVMRSKGIALSYSIAEP